MNVLYILIAFICGAYWGYAFGMDACERNYHGKDDDTNYYGPGGL